jgi:hypothetical protein
VIRAILVEQAWLAECLLGERTFKDRKENNSGDKPMRRRLPKTILSIAAGLVLLWHTGESGAQVILAGGPDAEVTEDGLHRVDPSIIGAAWVRPDLDLSRYRRIFFMPTAVQFREVDERVITSRDTATEFAVSDLMKTHLRELFGESFYEAVGEAESFELSDGVGRDVLMVRGLLTDVISGVPPNRPGRATVSSVRWAWEANIVMELRDSMSDDVLARTADRERVAGPFDTGLIWGLTPRIAQNWSRLLVRRLTELSELSRD